MLTLDILFSKYKWYRQLFNCDWYLVAPWPLMPYISPFWSRNVIPIEKVFSMECKV